MVKRKRREESDSDIGTNWMDTYGDMVTLLLTFFVMLFAMSTIDVQKFEQIIKSIKGSLGIVYEGQSVKKADLAADSYMEYQVKLSQIIEKIYPQKDDQEIKDAVEEIRENNNQMQNIYEEIKGYVEDKNIDEVIIVTNEQQGILIRFKENILFDSGKAILKTDAKVILADIANILREINKDIRVEGHTDNIPIHNKYFESNWELSAQRAANVVKYFIENNIDPLRLSLAGYSKYHPVSDNDTYEGRKKNRRVDVLILKDSLNQTISVQEEMVD